MEKRLLEYYAQRAGEYEEIYRRPERQEDFKALRGLVQGLLQGKDVLEVACGTGYWTEILAACAASVVATDLSPEVLDLAKAKSYPPGRVRFHLADAYQLKEVPGCFNAALVAFWWSHVPRSRLESFLGGLHARLEPGALAVIVDNLYVPGVSTSIVARDDEDNTYQDRRLVDGTVHRILKNFPEEEELRAAVKKISSSLTYTGLRFYWCLSYRLGKDSAG